MACFFHQATLEPHEDNATPERAPNDTGRGRWGVGEVLYVFIPDEARLGEVF